MYSVGQKVTINQFYQENYPFWKPTEGTITEIRGQKTFKTAALSKEERGPYVAKWGQQEEYTITIMFADFDGKIYYVSDLGLDVV